MNPVRLLIGFVVAIGALVFALQRFERGAIEAPSANAAASTRRGTAYAFSGSDRAGE